MAFLAIMTVNFTWQNKSEFDRYEIRRDQLKDWERKMIPADFLLTIRKISTFTSLSQEIKIKSFISQNVNIITLIFFVKSQVSQS